MIGMAARRFDLGWENLICTIFNAAGFAGQLVD